MSEADRIRRLLAATPKTLARVDAILDGTEAQTERDCRLVTYKEAAKRLGVSRSTVYKLAKAGRLKTVNINGINRIELASVFNLLNEKSGYVVHDNGKEQAI